MKQNLNYTEYCDKVRGCWLGKNIGGTLGGPLEGKTETNEIDFYVHKQNGEPLPNDDLDLQLIWLTAAERHGVYGLTPQLLAEYWHYNIIGPWNEYSNCRFNIAHGMFPPLSGSCNNDDWKYSNGGWIRSEIWGCIFPGSPDEAIQFAHLDACADHCGEGVYAEMFTAAIEAAAFVERDIRKLIRIGLAKIPVDCRVARSVNLVCAGYDRGDDWLAVRNAVVEDSADLGWFQAPGNLGFVVIGLLYGEGDFGKSICRAVNCGDDTDCTAATVGAILGIIGGAAAIPEKWLEPIGEKIKNIAISPFGWPRMIDLPLTIGELTCRVINLAVATLAANPGLPHLSREATNISAGHREMLADPTAAEKIWARSPYELSYEFPFGRISVDFENGVEFTPGKSKRVTLSCTRPTGNEQQVYFRWLLPESWRAAPAQSRLMAKLNCRPTVIHEITAGDFDEVVQQVTLEIRLEGRSNAYLIQVPFQQPGGTNFSAHQREQRDWPEILRVHLRGRYNPLA